MQCSGIIPKITTDLHRVLFYSVKYAHLLQEGWWKRIMIDWYDEFMLLVQ